MSNPNYEQRFVAFIDILGFSELVRRSEEDEKLFIKVVNCMETFQSGGPKIFRPVTNTEKKSRITDLKYMTFSDSILVSSRSDAMNAWWLIHSTQKLIFELMQVGSLARGAVTFGSFYHDDRTAFGPALLEAHQLETTTAKYPRIIFSNSALARIHELATRSYESGGWTKEYIETDILRDDDGVAYLNAFAEMYRLVCSSDADDNEHGIAIAELISENIQTELGSSFEEPRIREKLIWVCEQFNFFVSVTKSQAQTLNFIDPYVTASSFPSIKTIEELPLNVWGAKDSTAEFIRNARVRKKFTRK